MKPERILFLSSVHYPDDDRIFFHLAKTLVRDGYMVQISTSNIVEDKEVDKIHIRSFDSKNQGIIAKTKGFRKCLREFAPDLVICSGPIPAFAVGGLKKKLNFKLIYDCTEWFPSKKNLNHKFLLINILKFLPLLLFNFYAACKTDGFIFGEYYKALIYRYLFFWKKSVEISYYPDLKYIQYISKEVDFNHITLFYSGKISEEKGFGNLVQVAKELATRTRVKLKIVGWINSEVDKTYYQLVTKDIPSNMQIVLYGKMSYPEFTKSLADIDFCLDLRTQDIENQHCLPIKIFYYAAHGRPVIYSKLRAIQREINVPEFGFLTEPTSFRKIADWIWETSIKPDKYRLLANNARKLIENQYNWKILRPRFLQFIKSFLYQR